MEDCVTIRPPRRIFRTTSNASNRSGGFGETVVAGLTGVLIGASLMLFAAPSDLFGHAKPPFGVLSAEPAQLAIVDGQTLWLNGTLVHLAGAEAPPRGRMCRKSDASLFDCGASAVSALAELARGHIISCRVDGRDSNGFAQGSCRAGETDLARGMIAAGWARATDNQGPWSADEAKAHAAHLGIWADQTKL
jgi:endonuclease YncB( thermonuclease family)